MIEVRRKRYSLPKEAVAPAVRVIPCSDDELLFNELPEGSAERGLTGVREGLRQG
jgi:hypothetical protein